MSEAIKPTPGPWKATEKTVTAPETEDRLGMECRLYGGNGHDNRANARLIAEAGTVFHETQCTPRQLVERVKELEEAAADFMEAQAALDNREGMGINAEPYEVLMRRRNAAWDDLEAALSKALPNTVAEVKE